MLPVWYTVQSIVYRCLERGTWPIGVLGGIVPTCRSFLGLVLIHTDCLRLTWSVSTLLPILLPSPIQASFLRTYLSQTFSLRFALLCPTLDKTLCQRRPDTWDKSVCQMRAWFFDTGCKCNGHKEFLLGLRIDSCRWGIRSRHTALYWLCSSFQQICFVKLPV